MSKVSCEIRHWNIIIKEKLYTRLRIKSDNALSTPADYGRAYYARPHDDDDDKYVSLDFIASPFFNLLFCSFS